MNAPENETPKQAARRLSAGKVREGYVPQSLHVYQTADGKPWCWRIRCKRADGEKWMRPMHANGHGFELGEPPAPPDGKPLYRLPGLLADTSARVWIVEGERCADALHRLGIVATTSGSATSADAADWTPLRGRSCVVWPDNDGPGASYAAAVVAKLRALGCDVRLVAREVVEALPEHGDCVDWLAAHPGATRANVEAVPLIFALEKTETGANAWPEPTPLPDALPPVQAFDAELLPESLRGWVSDIAERMQCPPDFPAVGALVALSGLVGARAVMAPKERDDWRVVPNLWGLIVGRPGVMKSPALGEVLKPAERQPIDHGWP